MWIVSVLPIGKAAPYKEFSYFSRYKHEEGAIAKIPARGKEGFGLIIKSAPVSDLKQHIRGASFSLQKISRESRRILSREFLHAVFEIANFHACSPGAVLADLVPQAVLTNYEKYAETNFKDKLKSIRKVWQGVTGSRSERITTYEVWAKKMIAQEKSVLIVTPTVVEAMRVASLFIDCGITTLCLHGELTKKNMREVWQTIVERREPLAIVGTPLVLSVPRSDIGAIIVERGLASGFNRDERPFLAIRICAALLAEVHGASFSLGLAAPSFGDFQWAAAKKKPKPNIEIIDMRPKKLDLPIPEPRKKFELFSPAALNLIKETGALDESMLLLSARRGLATSIVCQDCGTTVTCKTCGSALVLREQKGKRRFVCSYCGRSEPADRTCSVCRGWRLLALGIGTDRIAAEVMRLFPNAAQTPVDETMLASSKLMRNKLMEGIVIATEGIVPYLSEISSVLVVSIDSFLFAPEYSASERALQLVFELQGLTNKRLLVQSRAPEHPAMRAFIENKPEIFLESELELRKKFAYPPFSIFVRLSFEGTLARIASIKEQLTKELAGFNPQFFPGRRRGKELREHMLLRFSPSEWPVKKVVSFLRTLPPSFEIRVNLRNVFND